MTRPTVMAVFGTRPEAIKMAPVVQALAADPDINTRVVITAQHRQLLDQVIDLFRLPVHHDLDIMQQRQTLPELSARIMTRFSPILMEEKPDLLLVHGDTSTTCIASLAAFYQQVAVGHVEAGLRTDDLYNPFPEEMNRRVTSQLARLHFAPTETAKAALLREGHPLDHITVTGNTVIDALLQTVATNKTKQFPEFADLPTDKRLLIVTAHRRENWGEPMRQMAEAFRDILDRFPDTHLVFPMHPNPVVREVVEPILADHPRASLIQPLDYAPFCHLMARATLVLTDSGGIQEEAPSLGKPVLVMRTTTERPEALYAGTVTLVGTERATIRDKASELLGDPAAYAAMSKAVNPYGDGKAAMRTHQAIRHFLGLSAERPAEFAPLA
ncbi:MAG: UDP-N-acetylglucosamine 2-epimerase (non-hydrolyzing) [Candidatus Sericytochromatia bacterium]|nr:UDP-N-acetylglucosamine 2-epimerase (non-hydrolyzing) [Candidatus Sericytochromatia bacterium]